MTTAAIEGSTVATSLERSSLCRLDAIRLSTECRANRERVTLAAADSKSAADVTVSSKTASTMPREGEPIGLGRVDPRVAFERLGERDAAR